MAPEVPVPCPDNGHVRRQLAGVASDNTTDTQQPSSAVKGDEVVVAPPLPQPKNPSRLQTVDGMKIFRHEVDQRTQDRFEDVAERVQGPLIEYLRKNTKNFRPMAIRLMVLGNDEASAKPWMVVLCPAHTSKKVKQFFKKDRIMVLCRLKGHDDIGFEVTTISQTFETSASNSPVEVYGITDSFENTSNWSIRIRVQQENQRYATMGGMIVVTGSDNKKTYYGLTAGHVLDREDTLGVVDTDDDSGYTSQDDHDHHDSSDDDSIVEEPSSQLSVQALDPTTEGPFAMMLHEGWRRIGKIANASFSSQAINRDWAMIEDVEDLLKQPRHLKVLETDTRLIDAETEDATGLDVALMNVLTLPKSRVSGLGLPTIVLLPEASKFVKVFTLSPSEGFILYPGSSGAWVIAASSQTVIGHIVADDPFGDVYIVPLVDILADVKAVLDAKTVSLPDEDDISNVNRASSSKSVGFLDCEPEHATSSSSNNGGSGEGGGGGGGTGWAGGSNKPPTIHNGGGHWDPSTSTSAPNSGYYA